MAFKLVARSKYHANFLYFLTNANYSHSSEGLVCCGFVLLETKVIIFKCFNLVLLHLWVKIYFLKIQVLCFSTEVYSCKQERVMWLTDPSQNYFTYTCTNGAYFLICLYSQTLSRTRWCWELSLRYLRKYSWGLPTHIDISMVFRDTKVQLYMWQKYFLECCKKICKYWSSIIESYLYILPYFTGYCAVISAILVLRERQKNLEKREKQESWRKIRCLLWQSRS